MEKQNCWNCFYRRSGGDCFPCACAWFVLAGKSDKPRQVPPDIIEEGCKCWKEEI